MSSPRPKPRPTINSGWDRCEGERLTVASITVRGGAGIKGRRERDRGA